MKSIALVVSAALASLAAAALDGSVDALPRLAHRHQRRTPGYKHRRHHRRAQKCDSGVDSNASASASVSAYAAAASASASAVTSNSSVASTSTTGGSIPYPGKAATVGNVYIGMLPDGGGDGGSKDTMASLNNLISTSGQVHATFGQYAQVVCGTPFDGSQLLQVMDDLKASGAIFEPAVMPLCWSGFTQADNSQATAVCNVMKKFTDEGIEVRLRFAHEVNWYQTDGTYQGNAQDFKTGWATVYSACRSIAPEVKMFFTPNVASFDQYQEYFPDSSSTPDLIGIDYYPTSDLSTAFLSAMQKFHDTYASPTTLFAIGETGLGYSGSDAERMTWLQSIVAAKSSMQHLTSVAWFNYQKGYNFKICDSNDSTMTGKYVSFLQQS